MSENIIVTNRLQDPFARVSKKLLDDSNLSFKAKGIAAYLLGKPASWKLRVSDLVKHSNDGKASIRSALNELRNAGYAKYEQSRAGSVFSEGVWKISDSPIFSPRSGFQDAENPDAENRHLSKNEYTKNDFTKKPKETKVSSPPVDDVSASWKPNPKSKEQQLKEVRTPNSYPSQPEFEQFMEENCDGVVNYRPDLYRELCLNKWHKWNPRLNRWCRIVDWMKFVVALDSHITEAKAGS